MTGRSCRWSPCAAMLLTLGLLLAGVRFPTAAFAAAGDLDQSFGTGGIASSDGFGCGGGFTSVAVRPNGKVVLVGWAPDQQLGCNFVIGGVLAGLQPDGTPDATFGTGGLVALGVLPGNMLRELSGGTIPNLGGGIGLVLQTDGKTLVGGTAVSNNGTSLGFTVQRLDEDGTPDGTFGSGGTAMIDMGAFFGWAAVDAIAIQADGKIVAAGTACMPAGFFSCALHTVLGRLNADGTPDGTFGAGGAVVTSFPTLGDYASSVALQQDGKIVVAGGASLDPYNFLVARFNPNGKPDGGFGFGGFETTSFQAGKDAQASSVVIQPDQKILVGGCTDCGTATSSVAMTRTNPDGSPDSTFGVGGLVVAAYPGSEANGLALQQDGRILTVGSALVLFSTDEDIVAFRFDPDGSLDGNFGLGGLAFVGTGQGATDQGMGIALTPDGRPVIAGCSGCDPADSANSRGLAIRMLADAPSITGFSPKAAPVGTLVSITGHGFLGASSVKFAGVPASSFTVASDALITAKVPKNAVSGFLTVTTPSGSGSSGSSFLVKPKIKSFSPLSGPVGALITIKGTTFGGATAVRFNGVSATFTITSASQIVAIVPSGATTGPITVRTPSGTAKSKTAFTVQ